MNKLVAMMTLPIVIGACACNGGSMAEVTEADLQQHNWTLIQIDGQDLTPSARQKSPRLSSTKRCGLPAMPAAIISLVRHS